MTCSNQNSWTRVTAFAAVLTVAGSCGVATAGTIVPCNGNCTWSIQVDSTDVQSGEFTVDPVTGDVEFGGPVTVDLGGGASVALNSLSGNSDPILGFSVAAGTGAIGKTFSFNFSLPIDLSGTLQASSSVSYSLTSTSSAGAQIAPLNGHVVVAQEVDTDVGGLSPLNKGVDVGDKFLFTGGPKTLNSPVYTANSTFTGNSAYDLMSVTLGFSLSKNSNVGASGFVQQTPVPVPLPAGGWLLGSALVSLAGLKRRSGAYRTPRG
jgi:hypothetical protein